MDVPEAVIRTEVGPHACDVGCCTANNIVNHGDDGYTCLKHGRFHVCKGEASTRRDDPTTRHPVTLVSHDLEYTCGFSGAVLGSCKSAHDYSDDKFSSHRIDDDCMGAKGAIASENEPTVLTDAVSRRRHGSPPRSHRQPRFPGEGGQRLAESVRRVVALLTDGGARAALSKTHADRALAEFRAADRRYLRASRKKCVRPSRPLRDIVAEQLLQKHRRTLPGFDAIDRSAWTQATLLMWQELVSKAPPGAPIPDSCATFALGCLYALAAGITHDKTGAVAWRGDPALAAALPPPQDLPELGVQQKTRSTGHKQFYRLFDVRVSNGGDPVAACKDLARKLAEIFERKNAAVVAAMKSSASQCPRTTLPMPESLALQCSRTAILLP